MMQGGTRSFRLPLAWTDGGPVDPFVVQATGRALFRPRDLLAVAEIVALLQRHEV